MILVVINLGHKKNQVYNFHLIQHLTESKYSKKFLIIVFKIKHWGVNLFPKIESEKYLPALYTKYEMYY